MGRGAWAGTRIGAARVQGRVAPRPGGGGLQAPTWDAHDGDHEEGGYARQDVEYGQPRVGSGCSREEEVHQVHEGDDGPAVQHEQQQGVRHVAVSREGMHVKGFEHRLRGHRGRWLGGRSPQDCPDDLPLLSSEPGATRGMPLRGPARHVGRRLGV